MPATPQQITEQIPGLQNEYDRIRTSSDPDAQSHWVMGRLRPSALGNMPLVELRTQIESVATHV